jgi:hypothetical protein
MTRVAGWFTCATAVVLLVVVAMAAEQMTVYVLPIPSDAATLAAKSGLAPVPFTRSSVFTVTIDGGRAVAVDTHHGAVVDGLDPRELHTVQVRVGARSFARFKFRIDESWGFGAGRKRVAIYMDSMYSNWRAWRCDKVRRCDAVQGDAGIPEASQTDR